MDMSKTKINKKQNMAEQALAAEGQEYEQIQYLLDQRRERVMRALVEYDHDILDADTDSFKDWLRKMWDSIDAELMGDMLKKKKGGKKARAPRAPSAWMLLQAFARSLFGEMAVFDELVFTEGTTKFTFQSQLIGKLWTAAKTSKDFAEFTNFLNASVTSLNALPVLEAEDGMQPARLTSEFVEELADLDAYQKDDVFAQILNEVEPLTAWITGKGKTAPKRWLEDSLNSPGELIDDEEQPGLLDAKLQKGAKALLKALGKVSVESVQTALAAAIGKTYGPKKAPKVKAPKKAKKAKADRPKRAPTAYQLFGKWCRENPPDGQTEPVDFKQVGKLWAEFKEKAADQDEDAVMRMSQFVKQVEDAKAAIAEAANAEAGFGPPDEEKVAAKKKAASKKPAKKVVKKKKKVAKAGSGSDEEKPRSKSPDKKAKAALIVKWNGMKPKENIVMTCEDSKAGKIGKYWSIARVGAKTLQCAGAIKNKSDTISVGQEGFKCRTVTEKTHESEAAAKSYMEKYQQKKEKGGYQVGKFWEMEMEVEVEVSEEDDIEGLLDSDSDED